MKDSMDSIALGRGPDSEAFANRKLIRPVLNRNERPRPENGDRRERVERPERPPVNGKKVAPPEQTHAENFYYQKQMQAKTPMVLVLQDDEEIHGVIDCSYSPHQPAHTQRNLFKSSFASHFSLDFSVSSQVTSRPVYAAVRAIMHDNADSAPAAA